MNSKTRLEKFKQELEIKNLESRLESARQSFDFWTEKEEKERMSPQFTGEISNNYFRFLKKKRKAAKSDVEYFSKKLEEAKSKL